MDGFRAPLCACVSVCAERANEATRNKVKKEKKKRKRENSSWMKIKSRNGNGG